MSGASSSASHAPRRKSLPDRIDIILHAAAGAVAHDVVMEKLSGMTPPAGTASTPCKVRVDVRLPAATFESRVNAKAAPRIREEIARDARDGRPGVVTGAKICTKDATYVLKAEATWNRENVTCRVVYSDSFDIEKTATYGGLTPERVFDIIQDVIKENQLNDRGTRK